MRTTENMVLNSLPIDVVNEGATLPKVLEGPKVKSIKVAKISKIKIVLRLFIEKDNIVFRPSAEPFAEQ